MPGEHRNNAAEWAMYAALWPVATAVAVARWVKHILSKQRGR